MKNIFVFILNLECKKNDKFRKMRNDPLPIIGGEELKSPDVRSEEDSPVKGKGGEMIMPSNQV